MLGDSFDHFTIESKKFHKCMERIVLKKLISPNQITQGYHFFRF